MQSCNHDGFVIVHSEKKCPYCELEEECKELTREVDEIRIELSISSNAYKVLEEYYNTLENEFDEYKEKYKFHIQMADAIDRKEGK